MAYTFSSLSPADFEDLARELIGKELRVRFEAFCPGPDGGIDGRHAQANKTTILQCKHYAGSSFSSLKTAITRELESIRKLSPTRYILATSRPLTPANKKQLAAILGPHLKSESDIFGPDDLNALLRIHSDIERQHIKLWLSGSAVLERVVRAAAYSFTAISRKDIESKVRVYAENPSFAAARDMLEQNRVLIVSGPPGVGKTTLAEMLTYAFIGQEWELVAIRSLEDGFAAIVDARKQIFLFDDFLGKVSLDVRALSAKDSDLVKFIKRVQGSPNARFILTTRAYIFEEARRVSEYLSDGRLDVMKYVLDVGIYTRRIKARILYNHLYVHNTPKEHIRALLNAPDTLPSIIDHRNYNPRIIEWMTDEINVGAIAPEEYPATFLQTLENPARIWDTAFRTHIPVKCQHLLFALFFCSEYGASIEDLKDAYEPVHKGLSHRFGHTHDAKDFSEALRILEGSFVRISNGKVSFINPSVRDYLTDYLKDFSLLCELAPFAQSAQWSRELWKQFLLLENATEEQNVVFIRKLENVAVNLMQFPVWKRDPQEQNALRLADLSLSHRIDLLLEWYSRSNDARVAAAISRVSDIAPNKFSYWLDGQRITQTIHRLRKEAKNGSLDYDRLIDGLESALISMIEDGIPPDDLLKLSDTIDEDRSDFSQDVLDAFEKAVELGIDEAETFSADIDSEAELEEQIRSLRELGNRVGIATSRVLAAVSVLRGRIAEVQEQTPEEEAPSFPSTPTSAKDAFDNSAIVNLFSPLAG